MTVNGHLCLKRSELKAGVAGGGGFPAAGKGREGLGKRGFQQFPDVSGVSFLC